MQLMPSVNLKQKQSLVMTPQLQQAIKLLQMTNMDIATFLEEQVLDNPFVAFIVWGVLAALSYHFTAGVKHLFMDMGYGETLESGPMFAKVSMAFAVVLIVLAGVWIW